ncbi:DNA-directed RNA polymerase sigma-70 factor [Tenuifilaceae bacterium CYCD]|nr:DNA-directed RNA polymerase sigma-70 factor [Tenuifilaceae bacterium CYCD]
MKKPSREMNIHSELVELCRRGDSKAQFELYNLYSKAMFNVSCRILPDKMEAEDAMQEAFFKAFDKLNTFRNEVAFGAWLKRIVVNTCIDYLKKKKLQLTSIDDVKSVADVQDDADDFIPESVEEVKLAMNQLPEGYRLVLSLHLVEGYEYDEIAEMLGIGQSSVRSQFTRARQKLLELLKQSNKTFSYGKV